ncbi:hypothetical protein AGMMS49546_14860 [Spirochaetia bacterium]|nr:hypothetical protein AGMMS49546_14860 [Spirochaetia bacterium]
MDIIVKKITDILEKQQYTPKDVLLHGVLDCSISDNIYNNDYWAAFIDNKFVGCIVGVIEHWGPNKDDYYKTHKLAHLDVKKHVNGKLCACLVIKDFRRKGIGKLLFLKLEEYFRKNGCEFVLGIHQDDFWNDDSDEKKYLRGIGFTNLTRSYIFDDFDADINFSIMVKYIGKN